MRRVLDRAKQSNKYWETRREWLRRDNDEQRFKGSMATATGALNERTDFHWKWKEHGTYHSEEERRREIEQERERRRKRDQRLIEHDRELIEHDRELQELRRSNQIKIKRRERLIQKEERLLQNKLRRQRLLHIPISESDPVPKSDPPPVPSPKVDNHKEAAVADTVVVNLDAAMEKSRSLRYEINEERRLRSQQILDDTVVENLDAAIEKSRSVRYEINEERHQRTIDRKLEARRNLEAEEARKQQRESRMQLDHRPAQQVLSPDPDECKYQMEPDDEEQEMHHVPQAPSGLCKLYIFTGIAVSAILGYACYASDWW